MKKIILFFNVALVLCCLLTFSISASSIKDSLNGAFNDFGYSFNESEDMVQLACGYTITEEHKTALENAGISYGIVAAAKSKLGSQNPLLIVNGEVAAFNEDNVILFDATSYSTIEAKLTYKDESRYSSYVYFGLYATDGEDIMYFHDGVWSEAPTPIRYRDVDYAASKFDYKFPNTDRYLYRVGNKNAVTLGTLFKAVEGQDIDSSSVIVRIDSLNNNASGVYAPNDSDWTKGTIQFSGTGPVSVIISCDDGRDLVLNLEVINATNATSATDVKTEDVVLLSNISGGFTVEGGHTLYGNGFLAYCYGDGSYRSASVSYSYVTVTGGSTLDNIQIICDIYPESYMYTTEMKAGSDGRYPYGYSAVIITGGTVSNSYIYGARNNIFVSYGDATIENTVLECGSLSNIQIKGTSENTVTLNNVTTIQYQTTSKYDVSKKVLGFGIIVGDNESLSNPTIKLLGDLKQYNWVTTGDTNVSNSYAKTAITSALKVSKYQHTINGNTSVNIGIAYLNSLDATIVDERSNKSEIPYELNTISMSGYNGKVYSITGSGINGSSRYNATSDGILPYVPTTNRIVNPSVTYDEASNAISSEFDYDNQNYSIKIDLDNISGGSYTLSFSKLNVVKNGTNLSFKIKDGNGNVISSSGTVTFSQLESKQYTLEITDNQIYGTDGELSGESVVYSYPLIISATKTSIEPPKFTNDGTATAIRLVEKKGGEWRPAYTALNGITVTYWSASENKVKTLDLATIYNGGKISSNVWTYTCDDFTLTITGGAVHSDGTTITPVVSNNTLYFASTNKAFSTGTTSRSIILTYVFTDKNDSTKWDRSETVTYSSLSEYDYNSFKNGTLSEPSSGSGSCVTPDTLVTLANGTQVRVDSLTGDELLLIWNMAEGKLDFAPIMFVDNDPLAEYEVVTLSFNDGTSVNVIYEHGFWDYDLNKYVYLDKNASDYIGHYFAKQNGDKLEKVQLVSVDISSVTTTAWSPVTEEHLCYFVNGMLSMPGGVGGLFNIFEVDPDTMTYDSASIEQDIVKYGLFTYEELNAIAPLSQEMFELCGGAYLKISIGKGNMTLDDLIYMINRYSKFY